MPRSTRDRKRTERSLDADKIIFKKRNTRNTSPERNTSTEPSTEQAGSIEDSPLLISAIDPNLDTPLTLPTYAAEVEEGPITDLEDVPFNEDEWPASQLTTPAPASQYTCITQSQLLQSTSEPIYESQNSSQRSRSEAVFLTPAEEATLVNFLLQAKRSGRGGHNGGFKVAIWEAAAREVALRSENRHPDEIRVQTVRSKMEKLRKRYRAWASMADKSGVHFDPTTGIITAEPYVWDDHIERFPEARTFMNGVQFPLHAELRELYAGTYATGAHAPHASRADTSPELSPSRETSSTPGTSTNQAPSSRRSVQPTPPPRDRVPMRRKKSDKWTEAVERLSERLEKLDQHSRGGALAAAVHIIIAKYPGLPQQELDSVIEFFLQYENEVVVFLTLPENRRYERLWNKGLLTEFRNTMTD